MARPERETLASRCRRHPGPGTAVEGMWPSSHALRVLGHTDIQRADTARGRASVRTFPRSPIKRARAMPLPEPLSACDLEDLLVILGAPADRTNIGRALVQTPVEGVIAPVRR